MRYQQIVVSVIVTGLVSLSALADDWPQWRGFNRDGKSAEKGLLKEWPKDGPPLAWKAKGLGDGFSGVAIAKGRIYTMGNVDGKEQVMALNEKDGTKIWSTPIGAVRSDGGGYPGRVARRQWTAWCFTRWG